MPPLLDPLAHLVSSYHWYDVGNSSVIHHDLLFLSRSTFGLSRSLCSSIIWTAGERGVTWTCSQLIQFVVSVRVRFPRSRVMRLPLLVFHVLVRCRPVVG